MIEVWVNWENVWCTLTRLVKNSQFKWGCYHLLFIYLTMLMTSSSKTDSKQHIIPTFQFSDWKLIIKHSNTSDNKSILKRKERGGGEGGSGDRESLYQFGVVGKASGYKQGEFEYLFSFSHEVTMVNLGRNRTS